MHTSIPRMNYFHLTSGAAAAAISWLICVVVGLPSKILLHHKGGSSGRCPPCNEGYTSQKKYQTAQTVSDFKLPASPWCYIPCPTMTPQISSFGTIPCSNRLKPINTHGKYGAVNTKRPKKLSLVSGFLLDHMYTSELLRAEPRKGIDSRGLRQRRTEVA